MMIPTLSRKWLVRALGATLGVVIVIGCAGTGARAEDDDDALPDVKFFRSLLRGIGLQRGDNGIDYRERSPLVVPPSRNLPPPVTTPAAQKNPAWPNDPDVKRRKEAKAARKDSTSNGNSAMDEFMRPLRPNELKPKTNPNRSASTNPTDNRVIDYSAPMKPNELGYKGGLFSSLFNSKEEEYGTFTGEAPRTSLIEPPAGYRTPSPAQPYGVGKEKWNSTPVDRQLPVR